MSILLEVLDYPVVGGRVGHQAQQVRSASTREEIHHVGVLLQEPLDTLLGNIHFGELRIHEGASLGSVAMLHLTCQQEELQLAYLMQQLLSGRLDIQNGV